MTVTCLMTSFCSTFMQNIHYVSGYCGVIVEALCYNIAVCVSVMMDYINCVVVLCSLLFNHLVELEILDGA
jgi:hypothetical protein